LHDATDPNATAPQVPKRFHARDHGREV
jgi:hypothetical protein